MISCPGRGQFILLSSKLIGLKGHFASELALGPEFLYVVFSAAGPEFRISVPSCSNRIKFMGIEQGSCLVFLLFSAMPPAFAAPPPGLS